MLSSFPCSWFILLFDDRIFQSELNCKLIYKFKMKINLIKGFTSLWACVWQKALTSLQHCITSIGMSGKCSIDINFMGFFALVFLWYCSAGLFFPHNKFPWVISSEGFIAISHNQVLWSLLPLQHSKSDWLEHYSHILIDIQSALSIIQSNNATSHHK